MLKDTKLKIEKMKAYEEGLMECLGDILEQHIPHPQNGANTNKKKVSWAVIFLFSLLLVVCHSWGWVNTVCVHFQYAYTEPEEDVISLSEILEVSLTVRNLLSGVLLNLNVMFSICVVIFYFLAETQLFLLLT